MGWVWFLFDWFCWLQNDGFVLIWDIAHVLSPILSIGQWIEGMAKGGVCTKEITLENLKSLVGPIGQISPPDFVVDALRWYHDIQLWLSTDKQRKNPYWSIRSRGSVQLSRPFVLKSTAIPAYSKLVVWFWGRIGHWSALLSLFLTHSSRLSHISTHSHTLIYPLMRWTDRHKCFDRLLLHLSRTERSNRSSQKIWAFEWFSLSDPLLRFPSW